MAFSHLSATAGVQQSSVNFATCLAQQNLWFLAFCNHSVHKLTHFRYALSRIFPWHVTPYPIDIPPLYRRPYLTCMYTHFQQHQGSFREISKQVKLTYILRKRSLEYFKRKPSTNPISLSLSDLDYTGDLVFTAQLCDAQVFRMDTIYQHNSRESVATFLLGFYVGHRKKGILVCKRHPNETVTNPTSGNQVFQSQKKLPFFRAFSMEITSEL